MYEKRAKRGGNSSMNVEIDNCPNSIQKRWDILIWASNRDLSCGRHECHLPKPWSSWSSMWQCHTSTIAFDTAHGPWRPTLAIRTKSSPAQYSLARLQIWPMIVAQIKWSALIRLRRAHEFDSLLSAWKPINQTGSFTVTSEAVQIYVNNQRFPQARSKLHQQKQRKFTVEKIAKVPNTASMNKAWICRLSWTALIVEKLSFSWTTLTRWVAPWNLVITSPGFATEVVVFM